MGCRWSHRTHRLCCTQPTAVERRSGRSVGDLAARPQGSVGDVLRAPGGGIVAPCRVLPGEDRREAREALAMGRRIRRPLLGTSSIRPVYSRRRRPAEAIESLRNAWEPIDARAGRVQEDRSLCIWWRSSPNWGSQPENLLLHDGPLRPDLVDPPGLAGDMASGRPEAVLQQEIPVI